MTSEIPFFTIGHSTRSIAQFVNLLSCGRVELVIDVRTVPRSRHNPQFNEDLLASELSAFGLAYRRMSDLGGLRGRSMDVDPAINGMWENRSFHNYADYALSHTFSAAIDELLSIGALRRSAVMCAEAVWWRCHRRIIADYLIVAGRSVFHLMGEDRIDPAQLTPGAVIDGAKVTYPG